MAPNLTYQAIQQQVQFPMIGGETLAPLQYSTDVLNTNALQVGPSTEQNNNFPLQQNPPLPIPIQPPTYETPHMGSTTSYPRAPLFPAAMAPLTFQLQTPVDQINKHPPKLRAKMPAKKISSSSRQREEQGGTPPSPMGFEQRRHRHGPPPDLRSTTRRSPSPAISAAASSALSARRGIRSSSRSPDPESGSRRRGSFRRFSEAEKGKRVEGSRPMEAAHRSLAGSRRCRSSEPGDLSDSAGASHHSGAGGGRGDARGIASAVQHLTISPA